MKQTIRFICCILLAWFSTSAIADIRILKSQPNILAFSGGKTPDREALGFHFIGPVTTRTHALIAHKDSDYKISSFEDIKKLNLNAGAMRQDWREHFLKEKGFYVLPEK